jgi:hypothetical protein
MNLPMKETTDGRGGRWLWLFPIVAMVLGVGGVILFYLNAGTPVPESWGSSAGPRNGLIDWFNNIHQSLLAPFIAGVTGVLILQRRPNHAVGWLLIVISLIAPSALVFQEWGVLGYFTFPGAIPGASMAAWITNWIWIILMTLVVLMLALFPDGDFLTHRWKNLFVILLFVFLATGLISTFIEPQMESAFQIANPYWQITNPVLPDSIFNLAVFIFPAVALCALVSLILRFRRGHVRTREQIKWLLVGVALFATMVVTGIALAVVSNSIFGQVMVNASLLGPLLGIGIAMLRHQLYDVDIIIRRTTMYAMLTALLALIYFASIVVLQGFLTPLTGESDVAVVLSTLLIAALFLPLRRRIQETIDRRFFRKRYDAEKTLEAFAVTVRNETDLDALTAELVRVIQETMQPEHVSVWLRPIERPRSDDGRPQAG